MSEKKEEEGGEKIIYFPGMEREANLVWNLIERSQLNNGQAHVAILGKETRSIFYDDAGNEITHLS